MKMISESNHDRYTNHEDIFCSKFLLFHVLVWPFNSMSTDEY